MLTERHYISSVFLDVLYPEKASFFFLFSSGGESLLVSSKYISIPFVVVGLEITILNSKILWGNPSIYSSVPLELENDLR